MAYKPAQPFNVAMKLLQPILTKAQGVTKKAYEAPENVQVVFFGSFRTFGGTERDANGVYTVEDTATIDCWYDPNIKAGCAVHVCDNGQTYEIVGTPENIDMRNQFMKMKVRRIGGVA